MIKKIYYFAFFSATADPRDLAVKRDGVTVLSITNAMTAVIGTSLHASATVSYRAVTGGKVWSVIWMTDAAETGITLVPTAGDALVLNTSDWSIAQPITQGDMSAVVTGAVLGFIAASVANAG